MNVVSSLAAVGVLALGLFLRGNTLVLAFERFEEYRIAGTEMKSVNLVPPSMPEGPYLLTISTVDGETIELEADNEVQFTENCRDVVERVIGSSRAYVQIVVLANADTMNGSLLLQCTDLHFLIRAD